MEETTTAAAEAVQSASEEIVSKTSLFMNWVKGLATWTNLFKLLGGILVLLVMWIVYRIILRTIKKSSSAKMNSHKQQMLSHFVKYIFYILVGEFLYISIFCSVICSASFIVLPSAVFSYILNKSYKEFM